MNARKFADNNNNNYYYYYGRYDDDTDIAAFVGNQSINCTVNKSLHQQQQQLADESFDRIDVMADVVFYLVLTLGIPGNVLSAVVWLRSHVARKNSSAIYLASHWPCVTDNSGITTYGLMALGREMSTPPKLQ